MPKIKGKYAHLTAHSLIIEYTLEICNFIEKSLYLIK